MIKIFTRQIEKLGSEKGQALVFVAMVGVVIFLFFAMTMNLAEVVNTKIKNQNVADATALSAAAWQARALNITAGLNENIYQHWLQFLFFSEWFVIQLLACQFACCYWTCTDNPTCILCVIFMSTALFGLLYSLTGGMTAGELQDDVLANFDETLITNDLPNVVDLNYQFKINTQDVDNQVFMYAHNNNGNLFVDPGGMPGNATFALTRGGWCELLIGLFYYACRNGLLPQCIGDWEAGLRSIYWTMNLNRMYRYWPWFEGPCYRKTVEDSNFKIEHLHPMVLMTYRQNSFLAQDPEEQMPMTVGIYRDRMPPVLHLWGFGDRSSFNCNEPPMTANNWFPCTDEAHYAFSSAHAYSEEVNTFYDILNSVFTITRYAIPVGFHEMDWQPRLFPIEPLLEEGEQSPECGWVAYQDIANQVGASIGEDEEEYIIDNVLEDPDNASRQYFLY